MAINKKLIHFNTKQTFSEKYQNNEILDTSIVFIKDANEIHTHNTSYNFVNWSILSDEPNYSATQFVTSDGKVFLDANGKVFYVIE